MQNDVLLRERDGRVVGHPVWLMRFVPASVGVVGVEVAVSRFHLPACCQSRRVRCRVAAVRPQPVDVERAVGVGSDDSAHPEWVGRLQRDDDEAALLHPRARYVGTGGVELPRS